MSMNIVGISDTGSYVALLNTSGMAGHHRRGHRAEASDMVGNLFEQLDVNSKGYLEKSDFASAFEKLDATSGSASTESVDAVFSALDVNADGKVTQDEMTSSMQTLAQELDGQFNAMRMQGMPPPPPPPSGSQSGGLTQDEISQIANTTSDNKLAELLNNLATHFTAADSDGDGKVSVQEALAYQAKQGNDSSTTTETSAASQNEAAILRRIVDLLRTYAPGATDATSARQSTLHDTA
jgi:Ca2+-binding EF-hand superfamily protein